MAKRQFINMSIDDLEGIAETHWHDINFLKKVKSELKNRKTKRSKTLLNKIDNHKSHQCKQIKNEPKFCSEYGNFMEIKYGKNGMFWGCNSYPHCPHTVKITQSDFVS